MTRKVPETVQAVQENKGCMVSICLILRSSIAPTCPQPSVNSERRLAHRQGRRALKASLTLGVLLGLFFSAWLPFFITNMAQVSRSIGN